MNTLKANNFRVGDEVEIVKLDKTIQHFGGEGKLSPVGTKTFVLLTFSRTLTSPKLFVWKVFPMIHPFFIGNITPSYDRGK